jgi:hypothetical protein
LAGLALIPQICIEEPARPRRGRKQGRDARKGVHQREAGGLGSLLGASTSIVKSQLAHQYMDSGFRGRDVITIE